MLREIQDRIESLPPAERRVANWILEHPRPAARATLAELAENCGSSEPTVIRFCRRFGLGSFRELALRLTEAMSQPASYIHQDVQADDFPLDAATKVVDSSIQSLFNIRAHLSVMPIEAAVLAMASARQLAFAGLGASGHVASDACHKFFRLGLPCMALTDTPSIVQFAAIAVPKDVLLITSHSGRWPEVANAAKAARARGSTVIAITGHKTELARHASILFPISAREDTSIYTPMSSRLAHLALLDALQVALILHIGDSAVDKLRLSKNALS